ncbi:ATP-grasp domain-containing protein [Corynebacterium sp.]|uniref:ATP-grasp domain-containing protein n=1 Tax=Corynebacterium sp. TaxID=1720 RepID=UPI0026DC79AA|nr:ATP-grasp domain-containing protein [Corynebacterium sp.]MDO5076202.1 ATP-grasp domain-containing protein [Corynebacterium sp.]
MMRFLITGIGGPAGIALANQLVPLGHEVCGVDVAAIDNPKLTSFDTVPDATDPKMIDSLVELLTTHDIDVVIPTVADELAVVSANKDRFGDTPVIIGDQEPVTYAHDKYFTMQQLHTHHVPVPRFALPSDFASLATALEAFGGTFVLKPRVGRGGRGFQVVTAETELDWSTVDDSMIIQEFAPGAEYCPNVYAKTSEDSVVVVLEKHDPTSITRADAPEVAEVARQAVAAMGLTGPVDIDIRFTTANTPVVLEVNARFGANSEQAPEILRNVLAELT